MKLPVHAAFFLSFLCIPLPATAAEARLVGPASKCLGIEGEAVAGARVVLESCDLSADSQRWLLPSPGFTGAVAGPAGLCLAVAGGATGDFTPIEVRACNGSASQSWRHEDGGRLVGPAGKCLDIEAGGTADGTPAILFGCHGGDNQTFLASTLGSWGRTPFLASPFRLDDSRIFSGSDPRILYLNGFWDLARSADGGQSWASVNREWVAGPYGLHLHTVDRTRVDRIFARHGSVLWRSEDGGRTWLAVLGDYRAFAQSPVDPAVFFAAAKDRLFRSVDHGATFELAGNELPADGFDSVGLAVGANGDLYLSRHAACSHHYCPGAALYSSRNLGAVWTPIRTAEFEGSQFLLAHPTDPGTLYWLHYQDPDQTVVERTGDGGKTWTQIVLPGSGLADAMVDPAFPDDLWVVGSRQVIRSRNRGQTWQVESLTPEPEFRATSMALAGGLPVVLAVKNAGSSSVEMSLSRYSAQGWSTFPYLRFGSREIYPASASARRDRFYISGGPVWRTDDGGRHWIEVQDSACPYSLAADSELPDVLYLGSPGCAVEGPRPALYRSTDAGVTLEPIGPMFESGATYSVRAFPWPGGTAVVALRPDFLAGFAVVVRSLDRFETFSTVALPGQALELLVDRNGVLFATDHDLHLYRSFDAGATWATVPVAEPALFAAGASYLVAVARSDSSILLSRDAGATWQAIPGPESWRLPGGRVLIDPTGRIFLFNSTSPVLVTTDEGRHWQSLAQDQPFSYVTDLVVDPFDADRLLLATGKGPYLGRFPGLGRAAPPHALALSDRFEAKLTWQNVFGISGQGFGSRLTDDTGLFWLFTPDRAEVAVKLLDGRAINGHYWLFAGGLTNVAFELEVHDRQTGERRKYHNPQFQFSSFGDLAAFPLGPATLAALTPPRAEGPVGPASRQVTVGGRFRIEIDWQDFAGQSGEAAGFQLSRDTAAFYFFDRANIEVLVNVVDGRSLNGHFWVFSGGLSNVAYRVTIFDSETGATKVYVNPLGSFASFGDSSAF